MSEQIQLESTGPWPITPWPMAPTMASSARAMCTSSEYLLRRPSSGRHILYFQKLQELWRLGLSEAKKRASLRINKEELIELPENFPRCYQLGRTSRDRLTRWLSGETHDDRVAGWRQELVARYSRFFNTVADDANIGVVPRKPGLQWLLLSQLEEGMQQYDNAETPEADLETHAGDQLMPIAWNSQVSFPELPILSTINTVTKLDV